MIQDRFTNQWEGSQWSRNMSTWSWISSWFWVRWNSEVLIYQDLFFTDETVTRARQKCVVCSIMCDNWSSQICLYRATKCGTLFNTKEMTRIPYTRWRDRTFPGQLYALGKADRSLFVTTNRCFQKQNILCWRAVVFCDRGNTIISCLELCISLTSYKRNA